MPAPIWLLDVDGVINANRAGWSAAPRKGAARCDGFPYTVRWEPRLIDRIRDLRTSGAVEVAWSTTWCGHTAELEALLGLPALPSAFEVPPGRYVGDVKLNAARDVLAQGRRLIWTDDMEVPRDGDLYDELTRDRRALLIRPQASRGLRPEHLDDIEAFAARAAVAC